MAKQAKNNAARARAQAQKARDREVLAKAKRLQKRGIIYYNKELKGHKVTDYMRRKVRLLEGILTGEQVFVAAPPKVKSQYKSDPGVVRTRKGVVVPAGQKGEVKQIRRNLIAGVRPLGNGYHVERIRLPVNAKNPEAIYRYLESGKVDRYKFPGDYFAFRIYGHGSLRSFPNIETLIQVMSFYSGLDPDSDEPVEFELFRVWPPEAWENMIAEERGARPAKRRNRKGKGYRRKKG